MKQLEIKTNKRLLIVEPNNESEYEDIINGDFRFICKGSYLTEGIAKGFLHQSIHTGLFAHYVKDIPVNTYCYKTALEAFDAVIYAYGYHWGENPVKEPRMSDYGWYASGHPEEDSGWMYEDGEDKYYESLKLFEESESRTFNPSKCIIFEIV